MSLVFLNTNNVIIQLSFLQAAGKHHLPFTPGPAFPLCWPVGTGNDTHGSGVVIPNISLPLSGEGTEHLLEAGGSPVCPTNQHCYLCEETPEQLHQTSSEHWGKEMLMLETWAPSYMTLNIEGC